MKWIVENHLSLDEIRNKLSQLRQELTTLQSLRAIHRNWEKSENCVKASHVWWFSPIRKRKKIYGYFIEGKSTNQRICDNEHLLLMRKNLERYHPCSRQENRTDIIAQVPWKWTNYRWAEIFFKENQIINTKTFCDFLIDFQWELSYERSRQILTFLLAGMSAAWVQNRSSSMIKWIIL